MQYKHIELMNYKIGDIFRLIDHTTNAVDIPELQSRYFVIMNIEYTDVSFITLRNAEGIMFDISTNAFANMFKPLLMQEPPMVTASFFLFPEEIETEITYRGVQAKFVNTVIGDDPASPAIYRSERGVLIIAFAADILMMPQTKQPSELTLELTNGPTAAPEPKSTQEPKSQLPSQLELDKIFSGFQSAMAGVMPSTTKVEIPEPVIGDTEKIDIRTRVDVVKDVKCVIKQIVHSETMDVVYELEPVEGVFKDTHKTFWISKGALLIMKKKMTARENPHICIAPPSNDIVSRYNKLLCKIEARDMRDQVFRFDPFKSNNTLHDVTFRNPIYVTTGFGWVAYLNYGMADDIFICDLLELEEYIK